MGEQDQVKAAAERLLEHICCGRSCAYRVDKSTPDIRIVANAAVNRAAGDAEREARYQRMERVLRDIASGHTDGCNTRRSLLVGRCDCSAERAREALSASTAPRADAEGQGE